ncbi:MAG: hypothetical protein LBH92_02305 [Bacteroidales bacterium]|nr:hypothetical protein [Bacteroidales bacterium]
MKYIAITAIISLFSLVLFSQEEPYARAVLDTNSIIIGQQVKMQLEVVAKNNERVYWADIPQEIIPGVEVISRSTIDSVKEDNNNILRQTLSITSFDTGFYALTPFKFSYYKPNDTTSYFTQSPSVWLEVGTVAVDTTQAFIDIKPLMKAPVTFREILPFIIVPLLLAAIVAFAIWFFMRRQNNKPVFRFAQTKPKIPADIVALEALEKLRHEKMWQAGKVKEYYTALADILRVYIENRFTVQAVEMTTDEILSGVKNMEINEQALSKLANILQTADLVKFAKASPSPLENDSVLAYGVDFVRETKAQPVMEEKREAVQNEPLAVLENDITKPEITDNDEVENQSQNVTP